MTSTPTPRMILSCLDSLLLVQITSSQGLSGNPGASQDLLRGIARLKLFIVILMHYMPFSFLAILIFALMMKKQKRLTLLEL